MKRKRRAPMTRPRFLDSCEAARLHLIRDVIQKAIDETESFESEDQIGASLAYLAHAIAEGEIVDWSDASDDHAVAIVLLFRAWFPPAHDVWNYILAGEAGR